MVFLRFQMVTAVPDTPRRKPVIAIVDNDAAMRDSLRALLRSLDVDVETFDSAESFLGGAGARGPRCLITELALPGMSGLDLLRRLRESGDEMPVILLAGDSDVPTAVAAMREGAADFIEKPHVDAAVLRRVTQLLRSMRRDVRRNGERS